jgi:APA family basic amino acid/polyamine antiporter
MAKDGLFFKSIAKIHPKFEVPSNSILLQGAIAIIMALSGTFEQILTYMGFALGLFPLFTVGAVFIQRRNNPNAPRLPGFPVAQVVYIAAGLMILVLSYMERPSESTIAIVTVLIGIPAYYLFRKSNGKMA